MGWSVALRRREGQLLLVAAGAALAGLALLPLTFLGVELAKGDALGHAARALSSARTWALFLSSVGVASAVTLLSLAIGLPLGVLVARSDLPFRRIALWLHAFPLFVPPFLLALGWFHLVGRGGIAPSEPLVRILFSGLGAILVLALALTPVVTSLVAVGLQAVDPSLEEAALLVASQRRTAVGILLPLIRPAIALAALVVFSLAFSELGVPMFLRVPVYPGMVFSRLGGVDYAPGEAFGLALPLLAMAVALLAFERHAAGRRSFAVLGLRTREVPELRLGRMRLFACAFVACAALLPIVPVAALATRAARGGGFGELPRWIGTSAWKSVGALRGGRRDRRLSLPAPARAHPPAHARARARRGMDPRGRLLPAGPGDGSPPLPCRPRAAHSTNLHTRGEWARAGRGGALVRPGLDDRRRAAARVRAGFPGEAVSAAIRLEAVTVARDGRNVLSDASLDVPVGETLPVLGASGSGKTTLLRVVAGFVTPLHGAVRLGDALAAAHGRSVLAPEERDLAMVFQDLALWPHLTVHGNLAFALDARKVRRTERDERIEAILARVGLAGKARRHPGELSGGERQRVAIARALVVEPRAVLLDEPLSNLDVGLKQELLELFRDLFRERGTTALYVTHEPREARALSARTAVIDGGRIVHVGGLEELRGRDDLPFVRSLIAALG